MVLLQHTRTLNVGAGTGITVNADDIAVNMGAFDTDNLILVVQDNLYCQMKE